MHVVNGGTEPDERLHQLVAVGRPRTQILDATDHFGLDARKKRDALAGQVQCGHAVISVDSRPDQQSPFGQGVDGSAHRRFAHGESTGDARRPLVPRGDRRENPVVGQAELPRRPFEDTGGPGQCPYGLDLPRGVA